MALRIGQTLKGARCEYQLTKCLSDRGVFKAKILPGHKSDISTEWSIVKTASPDRYRFLQLEHAYYMKPAISTSPFFRAMHDTIGNIQNPDSSPLGSPPCLVFEWMDCSLADVASIYHKRNSTLVKSIAEGVLNALSILKDQGLVHSDIKPDNVLISNLDAPYPIVKVGDLGAAQSEGFNEYPLQPYAMRAPEVWQRIGCFHSSDVWSLAVTLFDRSSPGVFGVADNEYGVWPGAWSMAKLLRLFPSLPLPVDPRSDEAAEFPLARALEEGNDPDHSGAKIIKCLSFENELKRMDASLEVKDFLRYLFVVDHKERPTAKDILHSPYYHALA